MTQNNDGSPAFPAVYGGSEDMSLRDWFAWQALASYNLSNSQRAAECAYELADAMLEARKK